MTDESGDARSRQFTDRVSERIRIRTSYTNVHGAVTRFVYQLEYRLNDEWGPVVRYDHNPESVHGHDVREEGLHIDVYRDGEQYRTEYLTPPMGPGDALTRAEDHLTENLEWFVRRFEKWYGIGSR